MPVDRFSRLTLGTNLTGTDQGDGELLIDAASGGSGGVTVLNYTEFTSNVTISGTSAGSPTTIVTASSSVTVGGSTLITVEFYCCQIVAGAGGSTFISMWRDSTDLGLIGMVVNPGTTSLSAPCLAVRRLTPSAGTYTFSIRGYRVTANGTATANVGGSGGFPMPGYIRITSGA